MSNLNSCKGKHLNLKDRIFIEYALDEHYTLKEIAKRLEKDPTTISKEIKSNRVVSSRKSHAQFLRVKIIRIAIKNSCVKSHVPIFARNVQ